jgi:hypothetical protein
VPGLSVAISVANKSLRSAYYWSAEELAKRDKYFEKKSGFSASSNEILPEALGGKPIAAIARS